MKLGFYAALAAALLMTAGWAKPKTARPLIDDAAMKAEAKRQLVFVYESRMKDQWRVLAITDRLLAANAELCPETKWYAGLTTVVAGDTAAADRPAVAELFGPGEGPLVSYVTADGPATAAGLKRGDEILKLDGTAVKTGKGGGAAFALALDKALQGAAKTIALTYRRDGEEHEATLSPKRRCSYGTAILDDPALNAYADGRTIFVTRPMLRIAATDEELALVLAHELAHNAEGHSKAKSKNAAIGLLGGGAIDLVLAVAAGVDTDGAFMKAGSKIGAEAYSVAFEEEADYVGLYYMTRAGYRTEGVEQFWRRMAVENPTAIMAKSSHPPSAERFLAIRAAREEIVSRSGQADGLVPQRAEEEVKKK
jgi:hypothetical protein